MVKAYDTSRPVQYERAILERGTDIYAEMYLPYQYCENYAKRTDITKPLILCEYAHAMGNLRAALVSIGTWCVSILISKAALFGTL